VVFASLTACIWCTSILVIFSDDVREKPAKFGERFAQFGRSLREAFCKRNTWLGVAIALVSGAGFEALGALAGPLLRVAVEFDGNTAMRLTERAGAEDRARFGVGTRGHGRRSVAGASCALPRLLAEGVVVAEAAVAAAPRAVSEAAVR
jgi:hypothetical protein